MPRGNPGSLTIGQLSVARRSAIARGWSTNSSIEHHDDSATPEPAPVRPLSISRGTDPDAVRAFTYQVALATQGPVLRYSQRLQLLALANEAGIARFDANLIIAAIENHRGPSRAIAHPRVDHPRATGSTLRTMLTAACVQGSLLVLAWVVFLR
jgi:hypothetical protein